MKSRRNGPEFALPRRDLYDGIMPRPTIISRQSIIDAALQIIDESGAEGLTIRALGLALNVNGASLYYHFSSKDAILEGVVESLLSKVEIPDESLPPSEWFLALATNHRAVFLEHPHAVWLLGRFSIEARTRSNEVAARQLRRDGVMGESDHNLIFGALSQHGVGSLVLPSPVHPGFTSDDLFRLAFSALYRGLVESTKSGGPALAAVKESRRRAV